MKIVIFGGGGFIGSSIVDRLLRDEHELRIFERPRVRPYRDFLKNERVEWLSGDMTSAQDVGAAIDNVEVILHLVSTTLPKGSNDDPIYDVQSNLIGTLQLLNAMVVKHVKKIIFISSGGTVYGDPMYLPVDERHPTEPRVSYGITKLAVEKYLLLYQHVHGINVKILRVANPFGIRQRVETAQGVVGVFLNNALQGKQIDIWGDGSITRDYLYVSDVAEAFARAIVYEGGKSIFNISSGIGTSINEIVAILERVLGGTVARRYLPGRSFDVPISVLDNTLAIRELGWRPRVGLEEGIVKTADWMRETLRA